MRLEIDVQARLQAPLHCKINPIKEEVTIVILPSRPIQLAHLVTNSESEFPI
jgi:hypothetical protein